MIIHEHKFIFVHVPRTGGTTIETAFNHGFGFPVLEGKHCYYRNYSTSNKFSKFISEEGYKSFSYIRNPWGRVVSIYRFAKPPVGRGHPLSDFCEGTFEEFVDKLPHIINKVGRALPIHTYVINTNGELAIDFVGRFENYLDDWVLICKGLGIEYKELTHELNTGSSDEKTVWDHYVSQEMIDKVGELYKDDIEMFGYTFRGEATKNHINLMHPDLRD
jgi:hypothetical protein